MQNCKTYLCTISYKLFFHPINVYLIFLFYKDYPSVDEVWVASTGEVILDTNLNIEQNTADDVAQVSWAKDLHFKESNGLIYNHYKKIGVFQKWVNRYQ